MTTYTPQPTPECADYSPGWCTSRCTHRARIPDGWAKHLHHRGELAVLNGPHHSGTWWWRTDLEAQQQACWDVHHGYGTPPNPLCCYHPTDRWVDHPAEVHLGTTRPVQGRIWDYEPRTQETTQAVTR